MISKKNEIPQSRKYYVKPKIEQVKLVAQEAVLLSCKMPSAGGGPAKRNCKLTGNEPCLEYTS